MKRKQCQTPGSPGAETVNMKERGHYMLKGKTVLLGVSGSIAAYKTAYLASSLRSSMQMCMC